MQSRSVSRAYRPVISLFFGSCITPAAIAAVSRSGGKAAPASDAAESLPEQDISNAAGKSKKSSFIRPASALPPQYAGRSNCPRQCDKPRRQDQRSAKQRPDHNQCASRQPTRRFRKFRLSSTIGRDSSTKSAQSRSAASAGRHRHSYGRPLIHRPKRDQSPLR